MRGIGIIFAGLIGGFVYGHGLEAVTDLLPIFISIVLIYGVIALAELPRRSTHRPRQHEAEKAPSPASVSRDLAA